jgi:hypothetical protein
MDRRPRCWQHGRMKRLAQAPNITIASLWVELLRQAGVQASVQRWFSSGIAGEIPPDQALPEVWVIDADEHARAERLLDELRRPADQRWTCPRCQELIEGPFMQCWSCGQEHWGLA